MRSVQLRALFLFCPAQVRYPLQPPCTFLNFRHVGQAPSFAGGGRHDAIMFGGGRCLPPTMLISSKIEGRLILVLPLDDPSPSIINCNTIAKSGTTHTCAHRPCRSPQSSPSTRRRHHHPLPRSRSNQSSPPSTARAMALLHLKSRQLCVLPPKLGSHKNTTSELPSPTCSRDPAEYASPQEL